VTGPHRGCLVRGAALDDREAAEAVTGAFCGEAPVRRRWR